MMTDILEVHTTKPGTGETLCGATTGLVIHWETANNPEHPRTFSCGNCLKILAGNVESMGGSIYLSNAHGAGVQ